jgi:hypothetical protein
LISLLQEISLASLAELIDTELIASASGTGGTPAADGGALASRDVDHLSDQEVDDLLEHLTGSADSAKEGAQDGR